MSSCTIFSKAKESGEKIFRKRVFIFQRQQESAFSGFYVYQNHPKNNLLEV